MGVATAIPLAEYDILAVDITKVSETKRKPKKPRLQGLAKVLNTLKYKFFDILALLGLWNTRLDAWKEALYRRWDWTYSWSDMWSVLIDGLKFVNELEWYTFHY